MWSMEVYCMVLRHRDCRHGTVFCVLSIMSCVKQIIAHQENWLRNTQHLPLDQWDIDFTGGKHMLLLLLAGAGAGYLVAAGRARQQWRSLEGCQYMGWGRASD